MLNLPTLPDPSLPPGSWYTDVAGDRWLNCNDEWVPRVGSVSPSLVRFCCPHCHRESDFSAAVMVELGDEGDD
jgi:hypothetical protein